MANAPMTDNVNTYCTSLQSNILLALDELAPLQTIRGFNKANLHFPLTPEATKAKKPRCWRERRLAATISTEDRTLYRVACRLATRLIQASRAQHLARTIPECRTNLWQLWQKVICLLHLTQPTVHMGDGWTQSLSDSFELKIKKIRLCTSVLLSQLRSTLP